MTLANGIPSHDPFEPVWDRIRPAAFPACFRQGGQAVSAALKIRHGALDGKTLRGSGSAKLGPLHLIRAWATAQHLARGPGAVDAQSKEITASPALREWLDRNGVRVTIDAMGCPKELAATIGGAGGDAALTVKANQPHRLEDLQAGFERARDNDCAEGPPDVYEQRSRGHGREDYRRSTVRDSREGIRHREDGAGLTVLGLCYSARTVAAAASREARYFIGRQKASVRFYAAGLSNPGGIEHAFHGQFDVTFQEDANRVLRRNGAEKLA